MRETAEKVQVFSKPICLSIGMPCSVQGGNLTGLYFAACAVGDGLPPRANCATLMHILMDKCIPLAPARELRYHKRLSEKTAKRGTSA